MTKVDTLHLNNSYYYYYYYYAKGHSCRTFA